MYFGLRKNVCFVQIFFSNNTRVRIFFPEFNIRKYDKNSESDYFFFLHQNQNIFLEPPPEVKWSVPNHDSEWSIPLYRYEDTDGGG